MNRLKRITPTTALVGVIVLLVCVGVLGIFLSGRAASEARMKTDAESLIVRAVSSSDHMQGSLSAPIQLIVYADLSCTYCKAFFNSTLTKLHTSYGDRIVVAYRHLPLVSHPNSRREADAAECVAHVGGNDAFWRFVLAVFARPDYDKGLSDGVLSDIASTSGVPGAQLMNCLKAGDAEPLVSRDELEASVAGIAETPSIVLKSATRALIVKGNMYGELNTGIEYLMRLQENALLK